MSQQQNNQMQQHFYRASAADFGKIPGSPIGYWVSNQILNTFSFNPVSSVAKTRVGCQTSDNNRFLRLWHEVSVLESKYNSISKEEAETSRFKWFPYNKGGAFRKWFGNQEYVVNWMNAGEEIFSYAKKLYGSPTRTVKNGAFYFRSSVTWSKISSGIPSFRWQPEGAIFDVAGASVFLESRKDEFALLAQLNSSVALEQLKIISPTLNYETSQIASLPAIFNETDKNTISTYVSELISNSKEDWDMYETSWNFQSSPLCKIKSNDILNSYQELECKKIKLVESQVVLESRVNFLICRAFKVDVPVSVDRKTLSLYANTSFRYESTDVMGRLQSDTIAELISYAIGCMMGRYSLDREGLVYAHAGNEGFKQLQDAGAYASFAADDDGILPLTQENWFSDDIAARLERFVATVWGGAQLEENLQFIADSLCLYAVKPAKKGGETARETIRRYLSSQFYKDHLKTYKKRPIYWLFSSGKEKAFEALVYLHRYSESTLPRLRTEYVTPLLGQLASQIEHKRLEQTEASTARAKQIDKEIN
ncbi:BREX-1 system adenine-specific DNA-methyltransferase PglX, partial [Shewanella sp.]|uniref:BREX-1 system adenine-specific DNA-methyltransferase PglX n=1 Tax=Shewanella sp. TaxID=50422 RepID=UPI003F2F4041